MAGRDELLGHAQPGGAAEARLAAAPPQPLAPTGLLLLLLPLLLLLELLDHLPHDVPGLALGLDRLGLPRHLHLQQILDLADVRQRPSHELYGTRLLLLLLTTLLLLAALFLLAALLLALCHGISSLFSSLNGSYPEGTENRQRKGQTGYGVYATMGGGTKLSERLTFSVWGTA